MKSWIFFFSLLLSACTTPRTTLVPPTATLDGSALRATYRAKYATPFVQTVISPHKRLNLTFTCVSFGNDPGAAGVTCVSSNGLSGWPDVPTDWSPDDLFGVWCVGANHDSPCAWFEVWDMAKGRKIDIIYYNAACYQWAPNADHVLAYEYENNIVSQHPHLFVLLDAATGEKTFPQAYPEWFLPWRGAGGCTGALDEIVPGAVATPTRAYP